MGEDWEEDPQDRVRQQALRIAQTIPSGERQSVLVRPRASARLAPPAAVDHDLGTVRMHGSARALLPERRAGRGRVPGGATKEPPYLSEHRNDTGVGAAAPSAAPTERAAEVRAAVLHAVADSAVGRESIERSAAGGDDGPAMAGAGEPAPLWAAGVLALDLTAEEVLLLADEIDIEALVPNAPVRRPDITEATALPDAITEHRLSTWGLERIGALSAWGALGARGQGTKVAVLDTGVDPSHPDIASRLAGWASFDAQGRQVNSQPSDHDGHGTHVCGTIVGGDASGSWIGVAPEAELIVGQVLGPDGGTVAQILAGIGWAITEGADVINMSLGGLTIEFEMPDLYTDAIVNARLSGTTVVAAIGNEGSQTTGAPGNELFSTAVGATDHRDLPAGFSGGRSHRVVQSSYIPGDLLPYVYSKPDLSAPGYAVASAWSNGGYKTINGTSMAAPHVSGAAALLLSGTTIRQDTTGDQRVRTLTGMLVGSVDELGEAGQDHRYGWGRLNVMRALGLARELGYR